MPVWRYRRIEDMPEAWEMKDARVPLGGRIRAVLSLTRGIPPLNVPRGVRKFRSIEELNADRDRWEQERVDQIRESRRRN
ncbi:MAG: hypothetical protein ACTHQM_02505 [Thermoanaerobaculia bacterium]